jgi:uncharacterized protein YktA (UPF0223 family)
MKEVFSNHLLQFIDSVDILEERTFKDVVEIIAKYLEKTLDINYMNVMSVTNDGKNAFGQSLLDINRNQTIPLTEKMRESGQMPFAFQERLKLWITSSDEEKPLLSADKYKDWWSGVTDIPRYKNFDDQSTRKTSIMIPLMHDFRTNEVIGVINFESEIYIEPTKVAEETLLNLAKIISKAMRLKRIRSQFHKSTKDSINRLTKELDGLDIFKLTKPKLFLGYPDKSEDDVMGCLKSVIDDNYSQDILLSDWKNKPQPKEITKEIFDDIYHSQYGVYYLSEIDKKNVSYSYVDNKNVIFEAGFHRGRGNTQENCLIIREKDSEDIFFDISTFKNIEVPRDKNGKLRSEVFRKKLKDTLDVMLGVGSN